MFELETARLRIIALDYEHFKMHLENNGDLQRRLHLSVTQEKLEDWFIEVMQKSLLLAEKDRANQYWYSNWQIVRKDENSVVGGICFKGPANTLGQLEIGYGIETPHQNQGYATEAIKAVVNWALEQDNIQAVIAETDKSNAPSQKVLVKNGFIKTNEKDDLIFWEKPHTN